MRYVTSTLAAALVLSVLPATAEQHEQASSSFVMHEYWQCDAENMTALRETAETVWGPIFDELVAEGAFLGHGNLEPTSATQLNGPDGAEAQKVAPDHQWFGWWESTSAEANDAAWAEFDRRLIARHPQNPRPFLYCDTLKIVTYGE